jgi:hypothetical protein
MTLRPLTARLSRWFRLGWIEREPARPRKPLLSTSPDANLDAEVDRMFGAVHSPHPVSTGTHQKLEE